MKKVLTMLGVMVAVCVMAQDKEALKYAKTITAEDLRARLAVIASDEFEGRETGKKGQKLAAQYIADRFKEFGLTAPVNGSYFQTFDLNESTLATSYFRKDDMKKMGFEDFIYYSRAETNGEEYIKVVMAGADDAQPQTYKGAYVAYTVEKLGGLEKRIELAKEAGAAGFLVVVANDSEFGSLMGRLVPRLRSGRLGMTTRDNSADKMIIADKKLTAWLYGKEFDQIKAGEITTVVFNADYLDKPIGTENVLGFLKGTEKPDEVIVITSHYDHIGISADGQINNGADDDGSGTTTVLELAQAFTQAAAKGKGPKRSILFMTVTGEEKGLYGSQYYVENPIYPLENTVTNLNIDMVGRVDDAHKDKPNFVYVIGSDKLSQELHNLSEQVNKTYVKMDLDYTYNDENDPNRFYYRSDHYNFAKNNVPIIFYFNGVHPDYHKPTDTIEKINFDVMLNRAKLVFFTAWEIANRDKRIVADKATK